MGVNRKACNIALLSETGQYPYSLMILSRVCKNWHRIINLDSENLLYDAFKCNQELMTTGKSQWLTTVKETLDLIGCKDIWDNNGIEFEDFPTKMINKLFKEKFLMQWESEFKLQLQPDKKLRTYAKFKENFELEKYLFVIKNVEVRKSLTRLRISAHNLPIETGRHKRPIKTPPDQRLCQTCSTIGNEFHYILECTKFSGPRKKLIDLADETFTNFKDLNDDEKFLFLMKCHDIEVIYILESFLSATMEIEGPL